MTEIDEIDRRILNALQTDGRITNQDLAQKVHLSAAACSERVKRLRERGVIAGYTALLDPAEVGLPLLIFVEVSLDRTTAGVLNDFAAAIQTSPEILECHMVAGGFDFLIKARVKDMAAYRVLLETLVGMPGVRETHTYAVLEEVKMTTALSI
ncbi:MAG TPA: Lrp/AsnC ligand binding domain-containing protein [Caulobacteraceae bacterium]|jgi:Lrp/AsnC family leucine-responsive transcriptional regulator|nr:Lrp/AsnC ligand binding domain-containing protein [Caulobacteraceae bacterium]